MTDDIVTRLRQQKHRCIDCEGRGYFECMNVYPKCESCGGSGVCRKCGDQDAADEIERLRADLENVRDINWKLEEELETHYRKYDPDTDGEPYDEY